jgi:aerobic carbon-monoxide dehydrogenase large subunit
LPFSGRTAIRGPAYDKKGITMSTDTHHDDHHHHDGRRVEDTRLITGAGRYASDWNYPGQLYGHFVRSDRAHAEIVSVNTKAAAAAKGVKGVFTGEDAVKAGYTKAPHTMQFAGKNGMKAQGPDRPVLAHGKVRFVGEAVALVVADTAGNAADAADLVEVEYRDLPAVVDAEAALEPGAPQLADNVPGNLAWEAEIGDKKSVDDAFAKAAHIIKRKVVSTRVSASPMEPRACLVAYDKASDSYKIHSPMQGITTIRAQLSNYTKVPQEKLIFEVGDVGGGFGQRSPAYPEYAALMIASKALGAPVKWVGTRTEGFLTDTHGRNMIAHGQLALDKDGKFLAMRIDWIMDLGAYLSPGAQGHFRNTNNCMTGVYAIPALHGTYKIPITNTTPIGAYRGAGRPDIAYAVEYLVDQAAAEIGMDPS